MFLFYNSINSIVLFICFTYVLMINQPKKMIKPPFTGAKADQKHQPTTSRPPTNHQQTTNSYININNNTRKIKEIYYNKKGFGKQLIPPGN